ncbi:MAG: T9SS type A sorting domain-containing protein [Bacteroidales bacterium]|nr:T9SS type A sorting domain-containing protein [Bacteroidales bacterium]
MKKISAILIVFSFFMTVNAQHRTDSLHVAHYDINLAVTDFSNHTISGNTVLKLVTKVAGLTEITLDLESLTVDSVTVNGLSALFIQAPPALKIQLPLQSSAGDTLTVDVACHGVPASGQGTFGGFIYSGQYCSNIGVSMYDFPHSFGRAWFPCLDEFTDKSTYTCNISTTSDKMAVCGGMLTDVSDNVDGTKSWKWELDLPIPTYLASIAVGNYSRIQDTVHCINGIIPIDIYCHPSLAANIASSFAHLRDAVHVYESRYGAYQWPRVGYVTVNFTSGAMEHATNIAYPIFAVNGNTYYEELYMHELAHSWFGNVITCEKAEEMWINEGFAEYSPALVFEKLYPSEDIYNDGYKNYIRDLLVTTLKKAHLNDGGYFALDSVPQAVTYGTHSYQKGAVVVHTLRNYLGDSLFFGGLASLLNDNAFKNVNSVQLFDYLSNYSGQDLKPFYEAWVHQPGFLHFSIDSIVSDGGDSYSVYVRQRLHKAQNFGNDNRIEITLFAKNGIRQTYPFYFSGEFGVLHADFPAEPLFGVVDFDEKISDAVLDWNFTLNASSSEQSELADFSVLVTKLGQEPLFLRVEHNYVAPDELKGQNANIYKISNNHFWRVVYDEEQDTLFAGKFSFKFDFTDNTKMDYELCGNTYSSDDLVLLYRKNCADDWKILHTTKYGNKSGMIRTEELRSGEYCLGVGNPAAAGVNERQSGQFRIYPNPANGRFTIETDGGAAYEAEMFDSLGRSVRKLPLKTIVTEVDVRGLAHGNYFIKVYSSGKTVCVQKVIVEK